MEVMESHGFGGESLEIPAGKVSFPLKCQIQSYVHIHKCPGNGGASDRAWNCLSSTSLGSKARTKDWELSTDKKHMAAVEQASRELSPTALLFSQTCRSECWGGKKNTGNENQATHKVILTVPLNLVLCKSTAQPSTSGQVRIWVWGLCLGSWAWLELWEAQTKKTHPASQPLWRKSLGFREFKESKSHSGPWESAQYNRMCWGKT